MKGRACADGTNEAQPGGRQRTEWGSASVAPRPAWRREGRLPGTPGACAAALRQEARRLWSVCTGLGTRMLMAEIDAQSMGQRFRAGRESTLKEVGNETVTVLSGAWEHHCMFFKEIFGRGQQELVAVTRNGVKDKEQMTSKTKHDAFWLDVSY